MFIRIQSYFFRILKGAFSKIILRWYRVLSHLIRLVQQNLNTTLIKYHVKNSNLLSNKKIGLVRQIQNLYYEIETKTPNPIRSYQQKKFNMQH
jgi:hypothetical protein